MRVLLVFLFVFQPFYAFSGGLDSYTGKATLFLAKGDFLQHKVIRGCANEGCIVDDIERGRRNRLFATPFGMTPEVDHTLSQMDKSKFYVCKEVLITGVIIN